MPSPTPPRTISRRDFPGKLKRNSPELPPKAARLVELMVRGDGEGGAPMNLEEVATFLGISWRQARKYFGHPRARQHYDALLAEMRDAEKPKNFHTARTIRDDREMAKSAAGNRARIEAAEFMEGRSGGVTVNVGVGINNHVAPGYIVDVSEYAGQSERHLRQARSTRSAIDESVPAKVIEHDAAPTSPPVEAAANEPGFGSWSERVQREAALPPLDSRRRAPPDTGPANEP